MSLPAIQNVVSDVGVVLTSTALLRLIANGIWRRYPAFVIFLAAQLVRSLILLHGSPVDDAYMIVWTMSSSALWILQIFVALEICALVFERYARIGQFADRILKWCMATAIVGATIFGGIRWPHNPNLTAWFESVSLVGRILLFSCALLMISQAAVFRLFPAFLALNLRIHRIAFAVYCSVVAFSFVLTTEFSVTVATWANVTMGIATAAIAGVWAFSFRTSWEFVKWSPATLTQDQEHRIEREYEVAMRAVRLSAGVVGDAISKRPGK